MIISKLQLIEMNACKDGLQRFIDQTDNTSEPVEVLSLIGGENTYSDLLWLAGQKLPTERIVRFACDCALISIELIKPYTDRYDEIVSFLENPAARAAARAANAAANAAAHADAARAATRAADAAAAHAVVDAANAADAAVDAAVNAAWAADAAGSKEKVNQLLKELFS